jgi:hypothetical protein
MARWVKIRRFHVREGVLVERALLQSAGIPVMAPDVEFYGLHPHIADTALDGYSLFVLDADVEDAQAILNARDDSQTSYPCPTCGGTTRRLKNVWGTLAGTLFFQIFGGPTLWPMRRRTRICNTDRTRFMPAPVEPFTADETGYPVEPPEGLPLKAHFLRFLAWTRSVGYDTRADRYDRPEQDKDR